VLQIEDAKGLQVPASFGGELFFFKDVVELFPSILVMSASYNIPFTTL
jgi:hypothetical protein